MLELNEYYYYANLALYYCDDCGGEFIVSCERTINTGLQAPFCPYCRSSQTQCKSSTTDQDRAQYHLGNLSLTEPK